MSPRQPGRTETCGLQQARIRLAQARAFLEVPELVGAENDELATPGVAASLAVLAGIAAVDAACCAAVGRRSRGQDHRQALALIAQIVPNGQTMSRDLDVAARPRHRGLLCTFVPTA
jgi:hypothetical protein